jgi:carboxyl-terminal processing protease
LVGHPGSIVVEDIVHNSPAQQARFMVGDQIIAVDGTSVSGFTVQQTAARLAGKPRSFITVEVFRKSVNQRGVLRIAVP